MIHSDNPITNQKEGERQLKRLDFHQKLVESLALRYRSGTARDEEIPAKLCDEVTVYLLTHKRA